MHWSTVSRVACSPVIRGQCRVGRDVELEPDPVVVMDTLVEMVGARGRVLPATSVAVDLVATTERGTVKGQVAISESGAIRSLRFCRWILRSRMP